MYKCKRVCVLVFTLNPEEIISDELYERIEDRFKCKFDKIKKLNKRVK